MNANQKFNQQDMEMIAMVNERTAARRKRREELELACIEQAELPVEHRVQKLQIVCGTVVRASIGLVFLGAITRELVVPGFGIAAAALCGLWAWAYSRRSRYGDQ